jgi:small subunit ribosomal protein S16
MVYSFNLEGHQLIANKSTNLEARVAIRFMRIGRTHEPFYRIIAVDSRKKRDTEPLEFLGWYNPRTKEANLNGPAIKKWLSFGAQPSNTVTDLFKRAAIVKVEE